APLGLFISDRMLGFLNVTQTGAKVAPPFILQTHWSLVGVGVGIVLAVFAAALAVAGMAAVRVADGRALRGE
ncbi:MAG TPA: hypothetical protein VJQ83_12140, partial [Tepidiformaceae bacterium]|nr:hypothetical protein [Tepidiformaceae bacterium]